MACDLFDHILASPTWSVIDTDNIAVDDAQRSAAGCAYHTATSSRRDVYEDIDVVVRSVVGPKPPPRHVQDGTATALRFKQRAPSPVDDDDDERRTMKTLCSDVNDTSQQAVLSTPTDHPHSVRVQHEW